MSPTPLRITEPRSDGLRSPPHNYEAERALLGAILMNNRAFERVGEYLRDTHFADPVNGRIYQACALLIEQGSQANPVTLKTYLERDDLVVAAGGMKYLANLAASAVTLINSAEYGRLVYDLFLRRELIAIGEDMVNEAFESKPEDTALHQIEATEGKLFTLAQSGTTQDRTVTAGEAVAAAIEEAQEAYRFDGKLVGVTTGLRDLDAKLGGLHASDLIILAGRPSMGKSGLAATMAYGAARDFQTTDREDQRGKLVALFSLEMSSTQKGRRILAHLTGIDSHALRTGRLKEQDFPKMLDAGHAVSALPLVFDDRPGLHLAQIRAKCRRLARKKVNGAQGLGLVIIDYLQLIGSPMGRDRAENRVQEISAITRGLKALAKELNVPVVALSQLSRKVEERDDKRPQLADLRESGTIEQDSDVVMFVYREEYYLDRVDEKKRDAKWQIAMDTAQNVGEVIVGKQRHGPIGTVRTAFQAFSTFFLDLIRPDSIPDPEHHGGPGPQGQPTAKQTSFELDDSAAAARWGG